MATICKALIEFPQDSALPRDKLAITPHFLAADATALANKLKSNMTAFPQIGATRAFNIKIYDATKPKPNYPLATASQAGTTPNSTTARELALCLSYYATVNRPRHRGRLYIPVTMLGLSTIGARPTGPQMDNTLLWRGIFDLAAPGTMYWVVYSTVDKAYYPVTHCWVDDEWDIIRSRGMRGTTRVLAAAPPG